MALRSLVCGIVLFLPANAMAQVFGTPEGCSRHAGNEPKSDSAWVLTETELRAHESSCKITDRKLVSEGNEWINTTCSGEGSTWTQAYILETTADPKVKSFYPEDSPDFPTKLRACE